MNSSGDITNKGQVTVVVRRHFARQSTRLRPEMFRMTTIGSDALWDAVTENEWSCDIGSLDFGLRVRYGPIQKLESAKKHRPTACVPVAMGIVPVVLVKNDNTAK